MVFSRTSPGQDLAAARSFAMQRLYRGHLQLTIEMLAVLFYDVFFFHLSLTLSESYNLNFSLVP